MLLPTPATPRKDDYADATQYIYGQNLVSILPNPKTADKVGDKAPETRTTMYQVRKAQFAPIETL